MIEKLLFGGAFKKDNSLKAGDKKDMDFLRVVGVNRRKSVTTEEENKVNELKQRVDSELKPEHKADERMFLRFLRARDRKVSQAEEMLRNHLTWRKEFNVDEISIWEPVEVSKYFPLSLIGLSKQGNPVRYLSFGTMDAKGILKSSSKGDCISVVVQQLEADAAKMKKISDATGKTVDQWIYIFDFADYSFSKATHKPTIQMMMKLFTTYEKHYPERLKAAYIINASFYFTLMFSVIKPLFTGHTLSKIKIFGKEGWKEELLQYVDEEELPVFLGGTRTDPDGNPMCPSVVNPGGLVPDSYFIRGFARDPNHLRGAEGVRIVQVGRRASAQLALPVTDQGSRLEWEFESSGRDIAFGLLMIPQDHSENPMQLLPTHRVDAHLQMETGVWECDRPGTYILVFDNTYSWIQSKEICCRAYVVTPSGEKIAPV